MADKKQVTIGMRVQRWRNIRGITQRALAARASVSYSLVTKVETDKAAATPGFVATVARALEIDPAVLYGMPYQNTCDADGVTPIIQGIRSVLEVPDLVPELDAPPRTLRELEIELHELRRAHGETHVAPLRRLPAALAELTVLAADTGTEKAWRLLGMAHFIAINLARRFGQGDLAALGIERARNSARQANDSALAQVTVLPMSLLIMARGEWDLALRVVTQAASQVDRTTPDGKTIYVALHLRAAIAAARAGRAGVAWDHHVEATEAAERLAAERVVDTYALMANPANARIHGCAVATELGDYDQALRLDQEIDHFPADLIAERRAHHHIDMARTLLWLGRHQQAKDRMIEASSIAPVMTKYHPTAVETVIHVGRHFRKPPEDLRMLERRMGL